MTRRSRDQWVADEKGETYKYHLTSGEFARTIGLEESTFKRWVRSGKIPEADAVSPNGWRLWSQDQVTLIIRKRAGV